MVHWWIGVAIWDTKTERNIAGTVIIDGTSYSAPEGGDVQVLLEEGNHTVDLEVPSGYQFDEWMVYDWDAGTVLYTSTDRPLTVNLDRNLYVFAIVSPAPPPGAKAEIITLIVKDRVTGREYDVLAGEQPYCTSGKDALHITVEVKNAGADAGTIYSRITDDTGAQLDYDEWKLGAGEGVALGINVDMPNRDYGITVEVGHL